MVTGRSPEHPALERDPALSSRLHVVEGDEASALSSLISLTVLYCNGTCLGFRFHENKMK